MPECNAKTTCKASSGHYSHCPSQDHLRGTQSTDLLQMRLVGTYALMDAANTKADQKTWSVLANAIRKELERRES